MSLRSVNANFTRISLRWRQRGNGSQPGAQYLRGDASRAEQDLRSGAAEYAEIGLFRVGTSRAEGALVAHSGVNVRLCTRLQSTTTAA